jgi:hypothetical protein
MTAGVPDANPPMADRMPHKENFVGGLTITCKYGRIIKPIDIVGDNFIEIDGLVSCEILDF